MERGAGNPRLAIGQTTAPEGEHNAARPRSLLHSIRELRRRAPQSSSIDRRLWEQRSIPRLARRPRSAQTIWQAIHDRGKWNISRGPPIFSRGEAEFRNVAPREMWPPRVLCGDASNQNRNRQPGRPQHGGSDPRLQHFFRKHPGPAVPDYSRSKSLESRTDCVKTVGTRPSATGCIWSIRQRLRTRSRSAAGIPARKFRQPFRFCT
jgi:hypothetical protein